MALGDEIEERVVGAMKQLGFTATDAKTYIALLRGHPATGYELAARSSVPRSAVYGVLRRLQSLGLVNVLEGKPARYVPLDPERLAAMLQSRFARNLDTFTDSVSQVVAPAPQSVTWTVLGYSGLLEQAERLLNTAETSVVASIWRREADALEGAFRRAVARGVKVTLFSFTRLPNDLGHVLSYDIDEGALERHWPHKLIVVADDQLMLCGGADATQENRAVVTEERALVEMALANLVLDITLYGERMNLDTGPIVAALTRDLAPVEELLGA